MRIISDQSFAVVAGVIVLVVDAGTRHASPAYSARKMASLIGKAFASSLGVAAGSSVHSTHSDRLNQDLAAFAAPSAPRHAL
jgi:hypothetical protein